ncbi:hypothetical protein GE09DRAFT_1227346 [Coniochaeta sp. 2T2.1]|nr:hypothetical protein GE09DRAFT_1227346 [Coniochaeta sp. 2T2.1]
MDRGAAMVPKGRKGLTRKIHAATLFRTMAFSDNQAATGTGYDRITFCNNFFKLNDLSDLQIKVNENSRSFDTPIYGLKYARILRNWVDPDPANSGYFTQRNADNYTWIAVAKHIESKIGQYPAMPRVGTRKPRYTPVKAKDGLEPQVAPANLSTTSLDQYQIGGEEDGYQPFCYPGCADRDS